MPHDSRTDELPRAVPVDTETFYLDRRDDFLRRHPDGEPPTYYVDYGDKCLHQFLAVEPRLTTDGQGWLRRTMRNLQLLMEQMREEDPEGFAELELDAGRFEDRAFETHSTAYLEAGLFRLPADDLVKIIRTPNLGDLLRPDGIREILEVVEDVSLRDLATILRRTLVDRPSS